MSSAVTNIAAPSSAAEARWQSSALPVSHEAAVEWTRLAEAHGQSPFCEPYWITIWRRHFGSAHSHAALSFASGAHGWSFAAPLELHNGVARLWRFPFNPHTPFMEFAAERHDIDALSGLIEILRRDGDALELGMIPTDGWLCRGLSALAQDRGMPLILRPQVGRAVLTLQRDWSATRDALSRELTSGTERKERNLAKQGRISYERVTTPERLAVILEECFQVELAAWKGAIGTAMASKESTRGFYTELAQAAAERDQLGVYTLRLDDRLIAFEYCLRRRGVVTLLKLSYLAEFSKQSPGNVLRLMLLRDELERGAVEYDFGIASEWKTRWTQRVDGLSHLCVYFNQVRGRLGYWLGPGLKRAIRATPGVTTVIEAVRKRKQRAKQARQLEAKAEQKSGGRESASSDGQ